MSLWSIPREAASLILYKHWNVYAPCQPYSIHLPNKYYSENGADVSCDAGATAKMLSYDKCYINESGCCGCQAEGVVLIGLTESTENILHGKALTIMVLNDHRKAGREKPVTLK